MNQRLEIPLNTVIPIDQVLTVPFQVGTDEVELELPVKADFPINMVVPIDFNEIINVDTTVALDTTIPVEIDIAQTPLVDYLDRVRQNVSQLKSRLTLLGEAGMTAEEVALAAACSLMSPEQLFAWEHKTGQMILDADKNEVRLRWGGVEMPEDWLRSYLYQATVFYPDFPAVRKLASNSRE